ncbi:MAG: uroporphyrinogen decarboxylase family protein [Lentisphaeria bacterium]|nr:uroporphyrinogen decarboxylase family protein [Lentisphaeria bacterium]
MTESTEKHDGVHALLPRDLMTMPARKLRDTYARVPGAPLFRREFGFYCLERWYEQGLDPEVNRAELFCYDPPGSFGLGRLGWCEAAFFPQFEEKVIEDRGDTEIVQDHAGRHVLYFKGRRNGFMPEYVDHPVKDWKTWEENVKWRLTIDGPDRFDGMEDRLSKGKEAAAEGKMISQGLIGGYMYLRSLIGPEGVLYMVYDAPDLIHDCMKTWFDLADTVIARHQKVLTLDEIFFAEDICFNHGPLISPDMMREFLFPYYQQLLTNLRARQLDPRRHLYIQIDTDGFADPVIPVYQEIGMDVMSPFEVASGCDVVKIGETYPDLVIFGGIDKRILASSKAAIDKELERILPVMRARGGFIPTCDHGVPEEVSLDNYLHYRKRCVELGG